MTNDRRDFLKFMGRTSTALAIGGLWSTLPGCTTVSPRPLNLGFKPIRPTHDDAFILPAGLRHEILIRWGEPINSSENFGTNNDFLAFHSLNTKADEGILLVNHEYFHPVLLHNREMNTPRTKEEVIREQLSVGNSLLHIKNKDGSWQVVKNSKYNRRITGRTTIPFQPGRKIFGSSQAMGTLANCAGGKTPWGTFLTCEENYDIFYAESSFENRERRFVDNNKFRWHQYFPNPPEHYGWVVEIEPLTGKAVKRTSLGRFEHECATVVLGKSGKPVVYMGEDRNGGGIFKFISDKKDSLESGTLYVADTDHGIWIPMDLGKTPELKKHFSDQTEVLTYARRAAEIAGGTPQDRPEDIEVDPATNNIIVALTNNAKHLNAFGSLLKISEKDGDFESLQFESSTFISGGPQSGFACPDNLAFDKKGNLWMTVDMPETAIAHGGYEAFGNNGLFYIPMTGVNAGQAFQVASAPRDAELTGPLFSPDYKTLFLSVQHPGSETKDPRKPTSQWPDGPGHLPKSAVLTISGPLLDQLMK